MHVYLRNATTSSEYCCCSGLRIKKIYLHPFFLYFEVNMTILILSLSLSLSFPLSPSLLPSPSLLLSLTPHPLGTPALTSRNMKDEEMEKVAEFIDLGMQIAFEMKDEMIKTGAVGKSGHVTAKVRH